MSGTRDYLFEIRGVIGRDYYLDGTRVLPYVGVGYRYLDDDSAGKFSSVGAMGYDRQANYYFSLLILCWCYNSSRL